MIKINPERFGRDVFFVMCKSLFLSYLGRFQVFYNFLFFFNRVPANKLGALGLLLLLLLLLLFLPANVKSYEGNDLLLVVFWYSHSFGTAVSMVYDSMMILH